MEFVSEWAYEDHPRRVIWMMSTHFIEPNSAFEEHYMKKSSDGQPFKEAVFATAYKLLLLIFSMLTQRSMFGEL
jgi:transposase